MAIATDMVYAISPPFTVLALLLHLSLVKVPVFCRYAVLFVPFQLQFSIPRTTTVAQRQSNQTEALDIVRSIIV